MTTAVLQTRPFSTKLTKEALEALGFSPLYGGTFWSKRFQIRYRSTNLGVDLTGATVQFTRRFGSTIITRKTGVVSSTAPTAQVILDNQASEDQTLGTGTGWIQVYDYPVATEIAEFETVMGTEDMVRGTYEVSVKFTEDKHHQVIFAGPIDCCNPITTFPMT